jgi:hypothetical protein
VCNNDPHTFIPTSHFHFKHLSLPTYAIQICLHRICITGRDQSHKRNLVKLLSLPNSEVKLLALLLREVWDSNLGQDIGYPVWRLSWSFSVSPGKYRTVSQIRPQPLPSTSLPIHYRLIILLTLSLRTASVCKSTNKLNKLRVEITVFCDVTPCGLLDGYQHFIWTCCLRQEGRSCNMKKNSADF